MLASKSFALNATAGAASQRVQIVLPTRAVSLATCNQCRGLQQHAQLMLVPRPAHGEAAAQRLRAAAVADGATSTTVAETAAAEGLLELTRDTWQEYMETAGDKLVIVDFFTDWCGPCKLIYPELVKLSAELAPAATIVKLNCNQANKELAKSLGIKVAPTFHLYRNGQKVADMTGAKVDKLRALISEQLGGASEQN